MRLAILGTGSMGSAIAERLCGQGNQVMVYNRTLSKAEPLTCFGAQASPDAATAIGRTEVAVIALSDASAVHSLFDDHAVQSTVKNRALLSVAMLSPNEFADLEQRLRHLGGRLSEAAITVYPDHVRQGRSQSLLACADEDRAVWRSVLADLGTVLDIGAPGNATKAYSALGCAYMFQTIAMAHGVAAFERMGLPTSVMAGLLCDNPTIGMSSAKVVVPQLMNRQYGGGHFSIDNFISMADHVIDSVRSAGLPTKVLESILDVYRQASQDGYGSRDVNAVYEQLAPPRDPDSNN